MGIVMYVVLVWRLCQYYFRKSRNLITGTKREFVIRVHSRIVQWQLEIPAASLAGPIYYKLNLLAAQYYSSYSSTARHHHP